MNIVILDLNQRLNAQYYCDKHVVKQITEFNQLLSSVYYFTGYIPATAYKLYGKNHPCAKWTRESLANWFWLRDMTLELCKEYTYRYGKIHKGESVCKSLPLQHIKDIGLTPFVQVMPEQYRNQDVVTAYRQYYNGDKRKLFKWTKRDKPDWIE